MSQIVKSSLAWLFAAAVAQAALAADIRVGTIVQVKPNSIWFEVAADLAQWQKLKKRGDAAALGAFEKDKLGSRDAWQFLKQLTVKVLAYRPGSNQVEVEMKTRGRFEGLHMFVDADALER